MHRMGLSVSVELLVLIIVNMTPLSALCLGLPEPLIKCLKHMQQTTYQLMLYKHHLLVRDIET